MKRVPIRLGLLRASVKPSATVSASLLESEGPYVVNASLARVCRVCTTQEARYTCPRCNTPYCSVDCYRSHGESCTEQFFESHVRNEINFTSNARGNDEKKQQKSIQELLERVQGFREEQQQLVDGEEDEEAFIKRTQELAVLDAAGELTLESLTQEERKKFLGEVADGRLGKLLELWSPWWLMDDRKYRNETSARRRKLIMEEIGGEEEEVETLERTVLYPVALFTTADAQKMPGNMKLLLPGGTKPSSCLRFHLMEVLFAYALVLRAFNGDYAQDVAEAALMFLDVSRVLSADARYESVEHVCLACLEKQSEEGPAANVLAITDAQRLLQSDVFLFDVLSDTRALLERYQRDLSNESSKQAKKERKTAMKRLTAVLKKVEFYQAWTYLTPIEDFQALAAETDAYLKEKELRS